MEVRPPRSHQGDPRKVRGPEPTEGTGGVGRGDGAGCSRAERGLSVQPVGGAGRDHHSPQRPRAPSSMPRPGSRSAGRSRPALRKARSDPGRGRRGAPAATAGARLGPRGPRRAAPARPSPSPGRGSPGLSWTLLQAGTPLGQSRPLPPRARLRRGSDSSRVSAIGSPPATRTAQRR